MPGVREEGVKAAPFILRLLLALFELALAFALVAAAVLVLPREFVHFWFVVGAGALGWASIRIARSLGLVPTKPPRPPWICRCCGYDRRGPSADAACSECGRV